MLTRLLSVFFLFLFFLDANGLSGQLSQERLNWIEKITKIAYADVKLSQEEADWVKWALNTTCDCNNMEEEEQETCAAEFIEETGIPTDEEGMKDMTPEQKRKFSLLMPLFSIVGNCPE